MLPLLFSVMGTLVWLLPTVLMIGWIVGMADPGGRWPVTRVLGRVSDPYISLTRGMLR